MYHDLSSNQQHLLDSRIFSDFLKENSLLSGNMAISDNYLEIKKRKDLMLTSPHIVNDKEQFQNKCVCFVKPNQPL